MCCPSSSALSTSRTRLCPSPYLSRNDVLNLIFIERSAVIGVQPTTLDGNGCWVNIGSNHLELSWAKCWQLCDQILVASTLFEKVAYLLNILWLCEASNEGRVRLSQDLVINIRDVLRCKNACDPIFPSLFENQFDQIFCGRVSRVWRKIRSNFVHEEEKLQFTLRWLLSEHPVVQLT